MQRRQAPDCVFPSPEAVSTSLFLLPLARRARALKSTQVHEIQAAVRAHQIKALSSRTQAHPTKMVQSPPTDVVLLSVARLKGPPITRTLSDHDPSK